ncbi:MAG TPA: response regulator transcription factor [Prolixibacteraceae bacterium]|nr:response regulator transcription factor [Prolixibacteraceae bacterium]
MKPIRLAVVDDHTLFREGLVSLLKKGGGRFEVAWEACNGREFLEKIAQDLPDVILMDISMPVMDGVEATQTALARFPELRIVALSMFGEQEYYLKMIQAGAKGFLRKDSDIDEVAEVICKVYNGVNCFSQEMLYSLVTHRPEMSGAVLSEREIQILEWICRGLSAHEIADKLCLSRRTVEKHRANILEKTNCRNTAQLVVYAMKNKFVR